MADLTLHPRPAIQAELPRTATWARYVPLAVVLALFGLGVFQRIVPAADLVFSLPGDVRFFDSDSYYHLRHTQFAVAHFPRLQRHDIGTHYPTGQRSEFAGLFDLVTAGTALVVGLGSPSEDLIDHVAAIMPMLLGLISLVLVCALVRRLAGTVAALAALLTLTFFPGPFLDRTLIGFYDHHAAEILLAVASTAGAIACLFGARQGARAWAWSLLHAAPMAAFVFTWAGGPIQLVVLGVATFVLLLCEIAWRPGRYDMAWRINRYAAALLVLVAVPAWLWPDLLLLPRIIPVFLGAVVLLAIGPFALLAVGSLLARVVRPALAALLILGLIAGGIATAVVLLLPSQGWIRLLVERKHALVQEHFEVSFGMLYRVLGLPGLLAILAVPLWGILVRGAARAPGEEVGERSARAGLFVALVGLVWLVLWVQTYDYNYAAPVWSAVLAGLTVGGARSWFRRAEPERGRPRKRVGSHALVRKGLAGALVLVLVVSYALGTHRSPVLSAEEVRVLNVYDAGWSQAMQWMAAATPQPTLPVDADVGRIDGDFAYPAGTYGVIVSWSWGNIVAARGRRVPVASQGVFASSRKVARWMLLTDEAESLAYWDEQCGPDESIRYVVLDAETLADHFVATAAAAEVDARAYMARGEDGLPRYGQAYLNTMAGRLFFGLARELSHYRLVYQTPHETHLYYRAARVEGEGGRSGTAVRLRSDPLDTPEEEARYRRFVQGRVVRDGDARYYGASRVPSVRIFERVTGAVVSGSAPAGVTVRATLELRSQSDDTELAYARSAVAGADGRFELTLPYSTDGGAMSDVVAMGRYELALVVDGRATPVRQLDISEERVQSGAAMDVGELRVE